MSGFGDEGVRGYVWEKEVEIIHQSLPGKLLEIFLESVGQIGNTFVYWVLDSFRSKQRRNRIAEWHNLDGSFLKRRSK